MRWKTETPPRIDPAPLANGDVAVSVRCPGCRRRRLVRWVGRPGFGVEGFLGAGRGDWWGAMNGVSDSENFVWHSFGPECSGTWEFTCNGSRPSIEGKGCGWTGSLDPDQACHLFEIGYQRGGSVFVASRA